MAPRKSPPPEAPPAPRRAAIYTRISSDDGTALGVQRQEGDCRRLAETRGWDVVAVFTDNDVSASTGRTRPAYEQMLSTLRRGDADTVVVWDLDRFTRRPLDFEEFYRDYVEKLGVTIASVGGDVDLSTPQGLLVAGIKANVARHEAQQASRRIRRKTEERAEAGLPHGKTPYGWSRITRLDENGRVSQRLEVNAEQAAVVRETAERIAAGESIRSVVTDLNARGILSPGGGEWGGVKLRQVLLRESNVGLRRHRGEVVGRAAWEPILDRELWEKVVVVLKDPQRRTSPGQRPVWLLSGIARCGRTGCGAKIRTLRGPKKGNRRRYTCSGCQGVSRIAEDVDEYVTEVVLERLKQPDAAQVLAPNNADAQAAIAEAADVRRRLDEAADAYAAGSITAAQLTRITAQLRPQAEHLEARARALLSVPDLSDLATPDVETLWESLPVERRRQVVEALVEVVILPIGSKGRRPEFDPDGVGIRWKS